MGKIHDPNLDAMFRNGQPPQPASLTVAQPLAVDAILAFIAPEQAAHCQLSPKDAVEKACEIFAEASVAFSTNRLHAMVTAKVQLARAAAAAQQ